LSHKRGFKLYIRQSKYINFVYIIRIKLLIKSEEETINIILKVKHKNDSSLTWRGLESVIVASFDLLFDSNGLQNQYFNARSPFPTHKILTLNCYYYLK